MNLQTFAPKAIAFASIQPTINGNLNHAALGIVSDMGELATCIYDHTIGGAELDRTNFIEECGDILWFANLMADTTKLDLTRAHTLAIEAVGDATPKGANEAQAWVTVTCCEVADLVKAYTIYGKSMPLGKMEFLLGEIILGIEALASPLGITLGEILEANIAKLSARYGEKFSLVKALRRDKQAERDAIDNVAAISEVSA